MPKKIYKSHSYTIGFYFNNNERDLEEKYIRNTEKYNKLIRIAIKNILKKS